MIYVKPIRQTYIATYSSFILERRYFNELLSTTLKDESYATYDETATYSTGDYVIEPNTKRIYRSAKDANTDPLDNELSWVDYGAVNSFRMFDEIANTQSKFTTSAIVEITANWHDTISFLNLKGVTSIQVVQTDLDTGDVVYDATYALKDYGVQSLYEYWYNPIKLQTDLYIDNLKFVKNGKLVITFTSDTDGYIGAVVTGMKQDLGITLYGTSVKVKDYSQYKEDEYGNMSFVRRPFARTISAKAVIDNTMADYIFGNVAELRGEINLFVGDDRDKGFTSLTTLGYIKDFEIPFDNPIKSELPITIIGVA